MQNPKFKRLGISLTILLAAVGVTYVVFKVTSERDYDSGSPEDDP